MARGKKPAPQPRVPDATAVAYRVIALGCLVTRAQVEQELSAKGGKTTGLHEATVARLDYWMGNENLHDRLSPQESELLAQPVASWGHQVLVDASWRVESIGVLLWALSLVDRIPPWDAPFDQQEAIEPLGVFSKVSKFMSGARLRRREDIRKARDVAQTWHWRARTMQAFLAGDAPPGGGTFDDLVRQKAKEALERGEVPELADGDFPAHGKAYRDLSEEEFDEASSIAYERHFALNWLCGYSATWDDTPTVT